MPYSLGFKRAFLAVIVLQTAHSIEEYVGRLWEDFPPAAFLTRLVSDNQETGFLVINIGLLIFGYGCLLFAVRRDRPSAIGFAWFWIVIETINGIGHSIWSIRSSSYTPGVITALPLLVAAVLLALQTPRATRGDSAGSTAALQ